MSNDVNVFGPFEKLEFAGATVKDFSCNFSWGDQTSHTNITLVEDPSLFQYFLFQDGEVDYDNGNVIGRAFGFSYGSLKIAGLLKSVDKIQSIDNYPTYRVTLASPVEVLDAAQVILSSYVGVNSDILIAGTEQASASFKINNLLNVYGWAENGGRNFGRSLATEIGMPWTGDYGIKAGLEYLTSIPDEGISTSNYGSYIYYKGNSYRLDLSNLPTPPSYYRLGGAISMTLLEVLTRFFEDAGVQWMVKLTINENNSYGPHTISFITVPRYTQQSLGKILPYILSQEYIIESSHGEELRSDITQAMLVGGAVNLLQPVQNSDAILNVLPFWGFDWQGNPIVGYKPDGTQYADDSLTMNLNATSVADIMGELGYGFSYPCSVLELRLALANYDSWSAYVQLNKPALANQLRMYGSWDLTNAASASTIIDLLGDGADFTAYLGNMFESNHWPAVAQRLYEFVRGQAEVYYGKKFIVVLPTDIQIYLDPYTDTVQLSNELCDAGYAPEGEQLLGLNLVNENFFMDQTGRFYPIVKFLFYSLFNSVAGQKILSPNLAYLKNSSTVVQYDNNPQFAYLYSRCEQGQESPVYQNGQLAGGSPIFFISRNGTTLPAVVVTIPDAIWAQAEDITGSTTDLAAMMGMDDPTQLQNIAYDRSTSFNLQIHPPAYYPTAIAVALKSNQVTYGPWGKYEKDGKLSFEQDDGLVPWEYGDYTTLTQAAIAKLNNIAMGNQVLERGEFTEAGIPKASPGEYLVDEGPILTSVSCNISVGGVTTTYTMETFVNRVGAFTMENADRLRRIGKIYQQLRRKMRQLIITQIQQSNIMAENYNGFMHGTSYAVEQHTPHAVLGARLYANNSGTYTPFAWTQTYQESLGNLGLNSDINFQSTACAGMEVLLRPYSTNTSQTYLPIMVESDPDYTSVGLITGTGSLNPIQDGCDINWLVSGGEYTGMKTSKGTVDYNNARSIALRGPIMMCGWGYDIQGKPVPNHGWMTDLGSGTYGVDYQTSFTGCVDTFYPDYLKNSVYWPTAPLDIAFDKITGTWMSRGMILHGMNSGEIKGPGSGNYMHVYIGESPTDEFLRFTSWLGDAPTGYRMQVGWNPWERYWEAVSIACAP